METNIRHYQPADQPDVCAIAADTAFFGEPVEAFLEDRRLFSDAFARYYIGYESTLLWVAEQQGELVGFLFGCANTTVQSRRWRKHIIGKVVVNALAGRYKLGRRTASFAWGMLAGEVRGEEARVDLNIYPAHLQIDVRERQRGEGVGRQLIEAYLGQLRQLNIEGVHLTTTSHNEAACHLYEKVGFSLLDERPNRFWTKMLRCEIRNRSYGLRLR